MTNKLSPMKNQLI